MNVEVEEEVEEEEYSLSLDFHYFLERVLEST